jgi:hypothetical protein
MFFYKSLWLIVVAFPLWRTGTLAGSRAEEMTKVFMWVPIVMLVVPWRYFIRRYVLRDPVAATTNTPVTQPEAQRS